MPARGLRNAQGANQSGGPSPGGRTSRGAGAQDFRLHIRDEVVHACQVAIISPAANVHTDAGISKEPWKRIQERGAIAGKEGHCDIRPLTTEFVETPDETAMRRSRVTVMRTMDEELEIEIRTQSCHQILTDDRSRSQYRI